MAPITYGTVTEKKQIPIPAFCDLCKSQSVRKENTAKQQTFSGICFFPLNMKKGSARKENVIAAQSNMIPMIFPCSIYAASFFLWISRIPDTMISAGSINADGPTIKRHTTATRSPMSAGK